MTLFSSSVRVSAAALLGGLILTAAKPVSAADYEDDIFIPTSSINCGYFVNTVTCYGGVFFADGPRPSLAGDTYKVHLEFEDRLYVPGSATANIVTVGVVDQTAVLGGGGPGPYVASGSLTMLGYEGPAGPFTETESLSNIASYFTAAGFLIANGGFSLTGMDAVFHTESDGPLPVGGYVAGFSSVLPATPEVLSDFQGGAPDSPVILPEGMTGKVNGNIGGEYGADQFYGFTWGGGVFHTKASIFGAAPSDEFSFKLFDLSGSLIDNVYLGPAGFTGDIKRFLDPGHYKIGLTAWHPEDPAFTIDFFTPVGVASVVPEPRAWTLLIAGFGLMGAALRTRPRRSAT